MLVTWTALNRHYPEMVPCAQGVERKRRQLVEEEDRAGVVTAFRDYDRPLGIVSSFRYPVRLISSTDYDCPAVIYNLCKSRRIWSNRDRFLGREGTDTRMSGNFYVSVVQAVLLFGSET